MKVYRVECPDQQRGPYQFSKKLLNKEQMKIYELMLTKHKNSLYWPIMALDIKDRSSYYKFTIRSAFSSKIKCKKWFGEFLPFLLNIGFEIYQYDATTIYRTHSGLQISISTDNYPRKIITHLFK